ILEVLTEDGKSIACQAVAQVKLLDRSVPRSLLGPVVREMLEHYLQTEVGRRNEQQVAESLQLIRARMEQNLKKDLARRSVELVDLTLRLIQFEAAPRDPDGFWMEFSSPEVRTVEGFSVVMDAVARVAGQSWTNPDPQALRQSVSLALHAAFQSLPRSLDLEALNRDRGELAVDILSRAYPGLKSAGAEVESLAITDIRVQTRRAMAGTA
ncbi:MAG: hypothetical protein AB1758_07995, partial [Candidatus Eremiobacterota bacterium]